MRVILIDDEKPALENLKRKIDSIEEFEIVGIYQDERLALGELDRTDPDIIFIDIEMRYISGLELVERIFDKNIYPKIVFVTAHTCYAHQAFELNAFDYIQKPVDRERLLKTINKIEIQKRVLSKDMHNSNNEVQNQRRIQCFGELKFICNNERIYQKWRTKKVEELFLYLLCNYDKAIPKDKLAELLWSGMEREKSHQYLYNSLYNLKKPGSDFFRIETVNGKVRLLLEKTDCDLIEFEKVFREKKNKLTRSEIQQSRSKLKYLYQGTLLIEYDYSWLGQYQRLYEGMYMRAREK